eukprot:CAMPEP_0114290324 /NCGR_PEP_ID=MMETSP0059-20121206/7873_1 /TAXON_ID=36894 /ORGANISM="Pyramimonas parkeae, Strain CCMP726" /LENGTH=120 /DNA_ID=CAMNT_0001411709 /DNA_START=1157 /DNA_END=1519 /DNA_ORIENTATION=+
MSNLINKRYRDEEAFCMRVKAKHPEDRNVYTGHSLGGGIAMYISEKHSLEKQAFNPALAYNQLRDPGENRTSMYPNELDSIRMGGCAKFSPRIKKPRMLSALLVGLQQLLTTFLRASQGL